MSSTAAVVRVHPDDWREARDVRLRALADAPGAFASSHAREVGLDEAAWRARLAGAGWFLALPAGAPVGLAVGIDEPDVVDARMLVSMWVEPAHRGSPTAAALVDTVSGWAVASGAVVLTAWVVDGNARARRFYARLGFVPDGARRPLPGAPGVDESRLRRALRP